jgi:hypothetical protein
MEKSEADIKNVSLWGRMALMIHNKQHFATKKSKSIDFLILSFHGKIQERILACKWSTLAC